MGGFTRILHSGEADDLMEEVPTHVVQPLQDRDHQGYAQDLHSRNTQQNEQKCYQQGNAIEACKVRFVRLQTFWGSDASGPAWKAGL